MLGKLFFCRKIHSGAVDILENKVVFFDFFERGHGKVEHFIARFCGGAVLSSDFRESGGIYEAFHIYSSCAILYLVIYFKCESLRRDAEGIEPFGDYGVI